MLRTKEKDILNLLMFNEKDLKYILKKTNISKRTFQYYLKSINYLLMKEGIEKIHLKDDKIIYKKEDIKLILEKYVSDDEFSKKDLKDIVKLYAIFSVQGLNITKLAEELLISRNTIKSIIKENDFEFINGKFQNLVLIDRTNMLKDILLNKNIKKYVLKIIDLSLIYKIKQFITEISKEIKLNLTDVVYFNLISYIYCYKKFEKKDATTSFVSYEEYEIIERIYKKYFNKQFGINAITDVLIGLSLIQDIDVWINQEFLLGKLIYSVSNKIGIDLTRDEILYDFLYPHLKIAIYRLKKNMKLNEINYADFIDKNSLIFQILKDEIKEIEKIYNIKFTEIELSLLAFHFEGSINRMQKNVRKRVILVCGLGYGSSKILEYNLKENFEIDIIDVLPMYMINENILKNKNVDYILTTTDLHINSIKINPLLKEEDCEKLINLGIKRKNNKLGLEEFLQDMVDKFDVGEKDLKDHLLNKYSNYFYTNDKSSDLMNLLESSKIKIIDEVKDLEEAIREVGRILIENKACTAKYVESMVENYRKFGTYIVIEDGVAIPHTNLETEAIKTDVAILILKKTLECNGKKVNVLLSYSSENNKQHLKFLKEFYNLLMKDSFITELKNKDSEEEIMNYLRKELS